MKNISIAILLLLLSFSSVVYSQNESAKFKITDTYILAGVQFTPQSSTSFADIQRLAPQSTLLGQDFTGYDSYSYRGYSGNGQLAFRVGLQSIKNPNRELQLGVSYGIGMLVSNYQSRTETIPYDTFTSAQTGEQIVVDSVLTSHVSSRYTADQFQIEASYIFRMDPTARWSFFGGVGAGLGTSLNAATSVYTFDSKSTNTVKLSDDYSTSYLSTNFDDGLREEFENKNVVNAAIFIPAGLDFRIGKRKEFWQQMHLFAELRPTISMVNIPELNPTLIPSLQSNVGFRLHW